MRSESQETEIKKTYTQNNINVQMDQLLMQGNKEDAYLQGNGIKAGGEVDFDPQAKKMILYSCLSALCVGNMMLDACYAFIPLYVKEKNPATNEEGIPIWTDGGSISEFNTTLILAIFSIAQIAFAPFNAYIKNKLGAKNTLLIGFCMITFTTIGLGVIAHLGTSNGYMYAALTLRFF